MIKSKMAIDFQPDVPSGIYMYMYMYVHSIEFICIYVYVCVFLRI
jgi:hypothetical protein